MEVPAGFVEKRRKVLIKFKSMQEILNQESAWFDQYGNLRVHDFYGNRVGHLTPSDFYRLGKTVEMLSHHSYPSWAIDREWDDMFYYSMALRSIASGKMSAEDMINLAKTSIQDFHWKKEEKPTEPVELKEQA